MAVIPRIVAPSQAWVPRPHEVGRGGREAAGAGASQSAIGEREVSEAGAAGDSPLSGSASPSHLSPPLAGARNPACQPPRNRRFLSLLCQSRVSLLGRGVASGSLGGLGMTTSGRRGVSAVAYQGIAQPHRQMGRQRRLRRRCGFRHPQSAGAVRRLYRAGRLGRGADHRHRHRAAAGAGGQGAAGAGVRHQCGGRRRRRLWPCSRRPIRRTG